MLGTDIEQAAEWLRRGELVAIPTETVYGLAANALDEEAVRRIFEVKQRPATNPLIVHIGRREDAERYAASIPEEAHRLMDAFMPGPLTILLPKKPIVSDLVTAGSALVALRMPSHPMALELLRRLDFPLAAPSANLYTQISPTTAAHVAAQLGDRIPYILDGGACEQGLESTIVGLDGQGGLLIYRQGTITQEAIEQATWLPVALYSPDAEHQVATPGQAKKHYSPRTPLVLTDDLQASWLLHAGKRVAVISLGDLPPEVPVQRHFKLGEQGDWQAAARHLYRALHELDAEDWDLILVPRPKGAHGLVRAISDRLERAAHWEE